MALFCKEGRTDLIGQFSYAKPNSWTPVNGWNFFFPGNRTQNTRRPAIRLEPCRNTKRQSLLPSAGAAGRLPVALPSFETDYISEISRKIVSNRPNHLHLPYGKMEALSAKLEKVSGKKIHLTQKTDPTVLAGLRVEMEGRQLDGTVQGRISDIEKRLNEVVV